MLHEAQRTSAPSSIRVSISTAVWIVMCSDPVIRAPFKGLDAPNSSRSDISPGISVSAISISLRPKSARPRSFTTKSLKRVSACVATSRFSKACDCDARCPARCAAPSAMQHIRKALYHAGAQREGGRAGRPNCSVQLDARKSHDACRVASTILRRKLVRDKVDREQPARPDGEMVGKSKVADRPKRNFSHP